jgi:signal transduction histidine kinase
MTSIKAILAPPIFAEDEEKTRIARLLNIILIIVMALVMAFSVPAFFMTPELGRIVIELILAAWAVFMLILLHRGFVRSVGFLFSFTLWLVVTYGTYEAGGFQGSTMSAYFGIILIAELLLGVRAGIIFGVLSIAATGWMLVAQERGIMPPPATYATLTTFWVEFSVVVVGVVGLLSLVMNSLNQALQRARRNEKELAQKVVEVQLLAQKATEANEFKSRLIARVSHELRTPLGALLGMSEMLQQNVYGSLSSAQLDITERIIKNALALEGVFAELLDQSQIESGQMRLKEEPFSPQQLAETIHANSLPLAQRKGLALKLDVDPGLPHAIIGDKSRTEQILRNLITNAIKFTQNGHIHVLVCRDINDLWLMRVEDTGVGMSSETLTFVFEPFRQADETSLRETGGVGLGLAIVKQLVTMMQGSIEVESEVGKGSIFTVRLPMRLK